MREIPVILGPTACGKTALAARLAFERNGEIISADSRQVYRGMDLGTGKDLSDYIVEGRAISYHMIDIVDPGYEYNIFEYQRDFWKVYTEIVSRGKLPILCGGSGMYIEAVLKGYELPETSYDPSYANLIRSMSDEELLKELQRKKKLHSTTDTTDRERMIRALEIENARVRLNMEGTGFKALGAGGLAPGAWDTQNPAPSTQHLAAILFGINPGREIIRQQITARLKARLENGMVEEVISLLERGVLPERLKAYGLEYKFLTQYILNEISYDEMFRLLNAAIHQFAKRQMTWFRRMERQGMKIHWMEGNLEMHEKVEKIREELEKAKSELRKAK